MNYSMGEGGAIVINNPTYIEKAEILREKGTNRSQFFRGQVAKYNWVDFGDSYLQSDLNAAYLWAQLEVADEINEDRLVSWNNYYQAFSFLEDKGIIELPTIPEDCTHNAHIDIVKPVGWPRSGKALNDTDMKYILRRMEKYGISSEKKIESAIRIVANENRYHPIRDYLNSLKWDGTERIAHILHHFLGAAEDDYTCEAMKIFLLGAIKRVFQPGCKFETMLCLVGGQGAGKSTFFRLLAVKDEWFSDDLRRLDDDNVFRKLQGHWIIEMSEMIATANAKSIEEIKSFLSKQKETYKIPYETHPADRLRQCVFAGTTNRQDFLPRDRTGNRRFIPIPVDAELAEVHILDNEDESRAYIDQLWAEAMTIYNSGNYKLAFRPAMQETLQAHQQDFMQEDAQAGMIYAFLEDYAGDRVCSKQLYAEALGNTNIPAEWETRASNVTACVSGCPWRTIPSSPRWISFPRWPLWTTERSRACPTNTLKRYAQRPRA